MSSIRPVIRVMVLVVLGATLLTLPFRLVAQAPPGTSEPPRADVPTRPREPSVAKPNAARTPGGHNVMEYGAVGDGKADDTASIQAAINAAAAAGGVVYFPVGHYRASGLTLTDKRAVTIKGAGYGYVSFGNAIGSTIRSNGAAGSTVLTLMNDQQCTVEDLVLDGNLVDNVTLLKIDSTNVPQGSRMVTVNRVALLHGRVGVKLNTSGVTATMTESVVLERLYCTEMNSSGTDPSAGVWVNSNNASLLEILSSAFFGTAYGLLFHYSGNTTIRNCYGDTPSQTFISLQGPYDGLLIDQCETEGLKFLELTATAGPNAGAVIQLRNCIPNRPIDNASSSPKFISIGSVYNASNVSLNNHNATFLSIGDTFLNGGSIVKGATDSLVQIDVQGNVGFPSFRVQVPAMEIGPGGVRETSIGTPFALPGHYYATIPPLGVPAEVLWNAVSTKAGSIEVRIANPSGRAVAVPAGEWTIMRMKPL
jgi:hypothetical protein